MVNPEAVKLALSLGSTMSGSMTDFISLTRLIVQRPLEAAADEVGPWAAILPPTSATSDPCTPFSTDDLICEY